MKVMKTFCIEFGWAFYLMFLICLFLGITGGICCVVGMHPLIGFPLMFFWLCVLVAGSSTFEKCF